MQLGCILLDISKFHCSALLCIGLPYKEWRWYPTVICYGLLGYAYSLPLHVKLGSYFACEKLRWRQLCLACFQTSAGKAGHPWQEPNRSYVKWWVCYATTEFINPQIDRSNLYYIPSSLSLVGHGWLEKGIFIYWITELLSDSFAYAWMGIMHQGRVEMALPCLVSCSKRRVSVFDDQICGPPFGTLIFSHSQKSICATVKTRHEEPLIGIIMFKKTPKTVSSDGACPKATRPRVNLSVNLALEQNAMPYDAMALGHAIAFLIIQKQLC